MVWSTGIIIYREQEIYLDLPIGPSWNDLVGIEYENVSYNIFCNHGKFDYPQMSKVMGSRETTKYITMIRDPVELFISAWYYSIHKEYKLTLGKF